ncbi:hypothetical protein M407DRAFT_18431 [Tulasnella calospora MUT 4182]|uniref:Calcineurin subunit B n=1 Tax=Tulasnella calospora MUT 4182 TaxID=1051891 RepID=A0A0C3MG16_9AGAM|nr:hypothetical protein M407DRAFT_18431 [Tulasnella calospora MUT 4182]
MILSRLLVHLTIQTEKQRDEATELFEKFDRNHDNKISYDEFLEILHNEGGEDVTEEKARAAFGEWDTNGDGVIDFKEYWSGVTLKKRGLLNEAEKSVFRMFDQDGDGFLQLEDVLRIFGGGADDLKDALGSLFKDADADGDGKLNLEEFKVFSELLFNAR